MNPEPLSRRQFLGNVALAAGALAIAPAACQGPGAPLAPQALSPAAAAPAAATAATATAAPVAAAVKRTAIDLVPLGTTGLKVSRLGIGLGSSNGSAQAAAGQAKFNDFIKHAYDQGITMIDTARNYATYRMMAPAIKALPRDKIFIQSKIEQPNNIMNVIDEHRQLFNTDYIDSMLVHLQFRANWADTWKRAMDDYQAAQEKQWIKSRGVSCHSLPALRVAIASEWTQVHLVRVNPQGYRLDTEQQVNDTMRGPYDITPVLPELKKMREKNRGVIGMKIFGGGQLRTDADREKSVKFAMSMKEIDSVIIGFSSTAEIDAGLKLMNKVLADLG